MFRTHRVRLGALSLSLAALAPAAHAASDADLAELREQLRQLKESYESRIGALEKRLAEAEAAARPAAAAAAAPARPATAGESAFNPGISLILSGTYTNLSQDPEGFRIDGFIPSGGEVGPPSRSFSLGESELTISASVDPYFRGYFTAALTPENEVEVEEAYLQTLALGGGATLKGGRFFSGVGYLNELHPHAWDFADAPLPYKAFLGGNLGNDGVQLKWLAPTETFLEFGVEAARGGEFPSTDRNKNGSTLGTAFAHVGGDVGVAHSWRAGLSYLRTSPREREFEDSDALHAFSGKSRTAIADFVWKWAPEGNALERNFKLQGEYFRRKETGTLAFDVENQELADAYRATQSGWYLQGVYQFMPRWRVGLRHDRLDHGTVSLGPDLPAEALPILQAYDPKRNTAMLDWSPSEFSRLRLQLARDESRRGETDNQLWLQYIMSLGAHGAHRF